MNEDDCREIQGMSEETVEKNAKCSIDKSRYLEVKYLMTNS